MGDAISVALKGVHRRSRDQYIAGQELDALNINQGEFLSLLLVRRSKHRSPECGVVGPPGPKMGMCVMGDGVDCGNWQGDEYLYERFIESHQDAGRTRVGADGSPGGNEGCAGERECCRPGKGGNERGLSDLPFGMVNDRLPPARVVKFEIKEQEGSGGGPIAARRGTREEFAAHGADERERRLCSMAGRVREVIDAAAVELVQRREREDG